MFFHAAGALNICSFLNAVKSLTIMVSRNAPNIENPYYLVFVCISIFLTEEVMLDETEAIMVPIGWVNICPARCEK